MNTYENRISTYSSAVSEQRKLMLYTVFASLCIGGFIGHQLQQFLEIMCAVRGTCYGNEEGFIYQTSLIHPIAIKLFTASIVLMSASVLMKLLMPVSALKIAGIMSSKDLLEVEKLYTVLFFTGSIFLIISLPLMFFSQLL